MAAQKLDIIAHGMPGQAELDNTDPVVICACVTKTDGTPVSGLVKSKVKVRALAGAGTIVGPSIKTFSEAPVSALAGYYSLTVAPQAGQVWAAGDYVFAVMVDTVQKSNTAKGRTLATVHIPISIQHV